MREEINNNIKSIISPCIKNDFDSINIQLPIMKISAPITQLVPFEINKNEPSLTPEVPTEKNKSTQKVQLPLPSISPELQQQIYQLIQQQQQPELLKNETLTLNFANNE